MSQKTWMDNLHKSDRDAFDAAEKIPQAEWKGTALCVPPGDDNCLFFPTLAKLEETYAGGDYPAFAWDCDPKPFTLGIYDAKGMVESALDEHHEDAHESITTAQWDELVTFLDGWSERTGIVSWEPNMKRAVLLTPPVLRVYSADGEEYVIAYSAEDAAVVYQDAVTAKLVFYEDWSPTTWTALPDEKPFSFHDDGTGKTEAKACAAWVAERGRGYFGSANV